MLTEIHDANDPRIEPYRQIRERDLIGRQGRFIAEGEVVLRILVTRSRYPMESLLLLESRVAPLSPLLAAIAPAVPIYVASRAVMDAITGFPIHRGILAIGRRDPPTDAGQLLNSLPEKALVVGLVGLSNHDNVGGLFRNAAAFGAAAVLLDRTSCDPLYRKAIRVSVGAALMVPFARVADAEAMIGALAEAGFETLALSPSGREALAAVRRAPRTALLVGAEGPGLPPRLLSRLRSVAIPMTAGFDSLNVATAAGIALHHLAQG
jgi:tRNA G18 (ribose-2'-O)-methylase SpoU